jgi:endonuclease/exonuclease/phosphatase family metal-dependent hydrolase
VARWWSFLRIGFDFLRSLLVPPAACTETDPVGQTIQRPGADRGSLTERIVVLSWNIHRGYKAAEIGKSLEELLNAHRPDLILLQEVPVYREGPFWEDAGVRRLLDGYNLFYAPVHRVRRPTTYYPFAHSGLLTLSKAPFSRTAVYPLPTVSRPKLGRNHAVKRVAAYAEVETADGSLGVCNVHLENTAGPQGRALQVRHLLGKIGGDIGLTMLLGGDFNTLLGPLETSKRALAEHGFTDLFAGSGARPLPRLDTFFVRGGRFERARRLRASGSDHQPILVTGRTGPAPSR